MNEIASFPGIRIAIAIATTGRQETLDATLPRIANQIRTPDRVLLSITHPNDVNEAGFSKLPVTVEVRTGPKGSCHQRNTAIEALGDCDVVVFLDDDFLMAPTFLAEVETLFASRPEISVATGTVIADGGAGAELSVESGLALLDADRGPSLHAPDLVDTYGAYGCNMIVRLAPVRELAIRFDERLPLYGWLEDVDFSRRLAPCGRIVRSSRIRGVHLGVKRGRSSGIQLGYSQVACPIYMVRKGTLSRRFAYKHLLRNVAANLLRLMRTDRTVNRAGRLRGNAIALVHLLSGRLEPENILHLAPRPARSRQAARVPATKPGRTRDEALDDKW